MTYRDFILAGIVILCIVVGITLVLPVRQERQRINKELQETRKELQRQEREAAQVERNVELLKKGDPVMLNKTARDIYQQARPNETVYHFPPKDNPPQKPAENK